MDLSKGVEDMIRITVEKIPFGFGEPEVLGTMTIANTSKNLLSRGDYHYKIHNKRGARFREGFVENFPRKRLLAWDLLYRVLRHAFGERNAN